VLEDRLRVEVREKLGAAYSPGVGMSASEIFPDDGWFVIQSESDLGKTAEMVEACSAVMDSMAEKGVTAEEIERVREPGMASIRDRLRNNGHWVYVLSMFHSRDNVLDDMRTFPVFLKEMTPEVLDPLAKKYLKRERASVAIVTPKKSETEVKDAAAPVPKKAPPENAPKKE